MAQTKRKRQTKHRGNAAGSITTRGRTGRPGPAQEAKKQTQKQTREQARQERLNRKPTWESSAKRSLLAAAFMFLFLMIETKNVLSALLFAVIAIVIYVPASYYLESFMWRRRMAKQGRPTT